MDKFALIGFGEAGSTFARAGGWEECAQAYDIKADDPAGRAAMLAAYDDAGVTDAGDLAGALSGVTLAFSLVTADQALAVAQAAAAHLKPGTIYCDMNSVAPQTKQAAAQVIEAAGGHYVDVAVMAPVSPGRMAVPLLLSGARAAEALAQLTALGFTNARVAGDAVGRASTIKMLRSVMYKGVEALTAECLIACEKAGVTEEVLGSFGNDWSTGADYRLDRMMVHGLRRSAEMAEVVKTLEALGVEPLMTRGTVTRQREIGALGVNPVPPTLNEKLERLTR